MPSHTVLCNTCHYTLLPNLWQSRPLEDALQARIDELETSTYCAYCGEKYPLDDKAASAVSEHIVTCDKHPMRKLEEEWDAKATSYRVERDNSDAKNVALQARMKDYAMRVMGVIAAINEACTYQDEPTAASGKYGLPIKCFDMLRQLTEYSHGIYDGSYGTVQEVSNE